MRSMTGHVRVKEQCELNFHYNVINLWLDHVYIYIYTH